MSRRPTEERRRGRYLGGHDIAAIVGANPYVSPADVYARHALNAPRGEQTKAMTRGLIIEHGLVAHIEERRGAGDRDVFFVDDERPFLGGSVDLITDAGKVLHEVTTCNDRSRHLWGTTETGAPSPLKRVQTLYYLGLSGAERGEVWCLDVGSDDLLHYVIDRDDEAISSLLSAGERFYHDHVMARVPPAPFDGWGRSEHLDLVWPGPRGEPSVVEVPSTEELSSAAVAYGRARDAEKKAKTEKESLRDRIHALLGDATLSQGPWGKVTLSPAGAATQEVDWTEVAIVLRDELKIPMAEWSRIVEACRHSMPARGRRIDVRLAKGTL